VVTHTEPRKAGGIPGKSSLFFLTVTLLFDHFFCGPYVFYVFFSPFFLLFLFLFLPVKGEERKGAFSLSFFVEVLFGIGQPVLNGISMEEEGVKVFSRERGMMEE